MTQLVAATDEEALSHQIIDQLRDVLALLTDAELAERGFVLTGLDRYLEPYDRATSTIARQLADVRSLMKDDPGQQQNLAAIEPMLTRKLADIKVLIDMRRSGDVAGAQKAVAGDA